MLMGPTFRQAPSIRQEWRVGISWDPHNHHQLIKLTFTRLSPSRLPSRGAKCSARRVKPAPNAAGSLKGTAQKRLTVLSLDGTAPTGKLKISVFLKLQPIS